MPYDALAHWPRDAISSAGLDEPRSTASEPVALLLRCMEPAGIAVFEMAIYARQTAQSVSGKGLPPWRRKCVSIRGRAPLPGRIVQAFNLVVRELDVLPDGPLIDSHDFHDFRLGMVYKISILLLELF